MFACCRLAVAVLIFSAVCAFGQIAPDPCATAPATCPTLINTDATSQVRLPNSVVDISLSITDSQRDLTAVQRTLGDKSAALLTYLRAQKVERLITSVVSYEPETHERKSGVEETVAYKGTLRLSFRTLPDEAPALLAGALANGATAINATNFTPTEEEIAAARKALVANGTRTAIGQAENVAQAAGLRIVSVRDITIDPDNELRFTAQAGLVMNNFDAKYKMRSGPVTQTESGDATLSITVHVRVAASH